MKVVCESCQAKYQVPDERVAGKKLKIRCKRCGATVLIRGDLIDNGAPQTGPAYERPSIAESLAPIESASRGQRDQGDQGDQGDQDAGGYEWHVSLDGDTRGPYSTDDLRDWLNNTPGGWDAHVWREGFPDWIDARACAELEPPPAPPAIASLQQEDELPTQTFQQHSSQFLSDVAAPRSSTSTSLGMQPVMHGSSSSRSRAPSGISDQGLRDDGFFSSSGGLSAMASPGYPSASPSSTATANGLGSPLGMGSIAASSPAYIPGPNPGFANGEGSGLIDIRALASLARQSTTQIAKGPGVSAAISSAVPKGAISETQLSYGADDDEARVALANQPTGFGRLDSLAPVSHTPTSNAALPLAILGGCALVAAAVLAAVLFTRPNRPAEVVSTPVSKEVQDSRAATAQPPNGLEGEAQDKKSDAPPAAKDAKDAKEAPPGPGSSAAPVGERDANEDELAAAKKRKPLAPRSAAEDEKNTTSPDEKAKPKKEEKPTQQDSPEVMLASQAKPIKQVPAVPPAAAPAVTTASAAASPAAIAAPATEAPKTGASIDSLLDGKAAAKPQQAAQVQPPKNRSIDELLNGADKGSAAPAAPAPKPAAPAPAAAAPVAAADGASDLPETPSRDEVLAAMRGVESAVRACVAAEQLTGTAEVAITVVGDTGRVTSANVTGITGNAGTCIARAVRNARFPHFTKPNFSIKYPYHF